MSYIQIEIGGKLRGIKFDQGALIRMGELIDQTNISATTSYAMIYAGLMSNCYRKREEPDFTFEQCCDWVDNINESDLMKVVAALEESEQYKKAIEKTSKPDTEKKNHSQDSSTEHGALSLDAEG